MKSSVATSPACAYPVILRVISSHARQVANPRTRLSQQDSVFLSAFHAWFALRTYIGIVSTSQAARASGLTGSIHMRLECEGTWAFVESTFTPSSTSMSSLLSNLLAISRQAAVAVGSLQVWKGMLHEVCWLPPRSANDAVDSRSRPSLTSSPFRCIFCSAPSILRM